MFTTFGNFLLLLFGFGFVIFVHELGHFAVAKWVGIKVEQFAIGFGTAACSWRKGIGFRRGSTTNEYTNLLKQGIPESELGETEYRLNWLPLGGYVKMLGQDDLDMSATTKDPRSFSSKSIAARMAVISAGVIMNVIFAVILFMLCFSWGVDFESTEIGIVPADSPCASIVASNADEYGITEPGLQPGDKILKVNGKEINSYVKVRMAAAIAKPGQAIDLVVQRGKAILNFSVVPKSDESIDGLYSLEISSKISNRILTAKSETEQRIFAENLRIQGLENSGIKPGMILKSVNGQPVDALWQLSKYIDESGGNDLLLEFADSSSESQSSSNANNTTLSYMIHPEPDRMISIVDSVQIDHILGLCPTTKIGFISEFEESSAREAGLREGDVFASVGNIPWPRIDQVYSKISNSKNENISIEIIRAGKRMSFTVPVNRKGMIGLIPAYNLAEPIVSRLLTSKEQQIQTDNDTPDERAIETSGKFKDTFSINEVESSFIPGTRIVKINDKLINEWRDIHIALTAATDLAAGEPVCVSVELELPTQRNPHDTVNWVIPTDEIAALHKLGWHSALPIAMFEMEMITIRATNVIEAIQLGFTETRDAITMTYLTLDRLFRGSVKVRHLKGPVGIVEIGTRAANRGYSYMLLFLGMISVNLAVLNFLPIPIVDGGLFVFLVIEKLKGSPVSDRIQILATYVGLFLIAAIFLITFFNDVQNLIKSFM